MVNEILTQLADRNTFAQALKALGWFNYIPLLTQVDYKGKAKPHKVNAIYSAGEVPNQDVTVLWMEATADSSEADIKDIVISHRRDGYLFLVVFCKLGNNLCIVAPMDPTKLRLKEQTGVEVDCIQLNLSNPQAYEEEIIKRLQDAPKRLFKERLQKIVDTEQVTKQFFSDYSDNRIQFTELITGIPDASDRRWYASVILNRLMFIYFLQAKGFMNGGDQHYLQNKLQEYNNNRFFSVFLKVLFFEGFAKPEHLRSSEHNRIVGKVIYLNGGLFLPHKLEKKYPEIGIPDSAFRNLFDLFERYTWTLDDTLRGAKDEINPDVLGYIFEKYINQKEFGAYYTRPEITEYLSEQCIERHILAQINPPDGVSMPNSRHYSSLNELLTEMDSDICRHLVMDVLPSITILDPACGSGAFLVAAMKILYETYSIACQKIPIFNDHNLDVWLNAAHSAHKSLSYFVKKQIISNNLFGVDIMQEATEIAKLRLFLALVSSAHSVEELEPLPNIDFNILSGNSLIGLLKVDQRSFDTHAPDGNIDMFRESYQELVNKKERAIKLYREGSQQHLQNVRDSVDTLRAEAQTTLDDMLLEEFRAQGVKYAQATWNEQKGKEGKPIKRAVQLQDIQALQPFHWGFEFDDVINGHGGFDIIITNPPWEVFQTDEKEFFQKYDDNIQKNKLQINDWKKQFKKFMQINDIRIAWLEYASGFSYVSSYLKSAPQFFNQISIINGKNAGSKLNLYTYFIEQCYNLLKSSGECGMVVPSGIYTDLGCKQLRELLFSNTRISGLFCFENRKTIFENVHRSTKFVVLTYIKSGHTDCFPAAFMRHEVKELRDFPEKGAMSMDVELIRKLSPDSLSIMEFKSPMDVQIAKKMLRYPLLGENINGTWNLRLTTEFNMTTDSDLFRTEPGPGRLPLYEGKMIHQFTHTWGKPKYWVDETEGRARILGRRADEGQTLDYQRYRLGFRDIASNTNERTLIASIIPKAFHGNKFPTICLDEPSHYLSNQDQLVLCCIWNSSTLDSNIRMKVTTTLNFHYIYSLPVPRLLLGTQVYRKLSELAATLICTTPEYDELAAEVGLGNHKNGVTDPEERAKLRAEIDAIVAHIYGLTEEEFAHVLSSFPLVANEVKQAAMRAYMEQEPG